MNSEFGRLFNIFVFIALLTQTMGCEKKSVTNRPLLYPVRGKILIDGLPPVGASIKFINRDREKTGQRASSATVYEDGSFMVSTYEKDDGMPPGKYAACIFWLEVPSGGGMMVDRLRGKFMDPNDPIIVFDVSSPGIDLGELRLETH